ncbi:MAG: porin, partial [Gammaproteobacteria bacterium]|nr:porin [Gammaproteobacteria bacterium]
IMIRNVTVIDQAGKAGDVVVSILIDQKKLELVTQDKIALTKADIAFDAKGGYILGHMDIGGPAVFIILDQDPRINVDVVLDTKSYAMFAISKEGVVLNKLIRIDVDSEEQLGGWQTYAPPSVALPLSYQSSRKWNVFRTKPVTAVLFGAVVMDNTRWLSSDSINEAQVGDLSQYDGGSIRGFRAGLAGTFNFAKPWSYIITFATSAFERGFEQGEQDEFILFEYKVNIPIGRGALSLGKQREPISIQRLQGMVYSPSQQERASVADGLLPSRNFGIVYNNSLINGRLTGAAGIFNGWLHEGRSFSESPTVFVGRVSGLPYVSKDESNLVHFALSGRYSNAAGGIRYKVRTEIFSGPFSVDTEPMEDASSTFHTALEMVWRKGPFILQGEYIQSNVNSSIYNDPALKGYYVVASYTLTGEMRQYNKRSGIFNRLKVANAVNSGGWGTWEVYSRWSSIDLTDKNITGGEMNTLSMGLNWWPTSSIQASVNYRYSTLDHSGQKGSNHGIVTRLVFVLE